MKTKFTKLIALLLAIMMLTSLCACGADDSSPTTDDNSSTSGTEGNDSTGTTNGDDSTETTNGNDSTGTTNGYSPAVPTGPNAFNCYFYYSLEDGPNYTVQVSSQMIENGYYWDTRVGNASYMDFATDAILEEKQGAFNLLYDYVNVLSLALRIDEVTFACPVEIKFISEYEFNEKMDNHVAAEYTNAAGQAGYKYTDNYGIHFLIDLGLENCFAYVWQNTNISTGTGTEFETLTFTLIKD